MELKKFGNEDFPGKSCEKISVDIENKLFYAMLINLEKIKNDVVKSLKLVNKH